MCDLRWSDLDFTHGKINVSRPKTNRGVRAIDMIPWLREELLTFRAAIDKPNSMLPYSRHGRAGTGRRTT